MSGYRPLRVTAAPLAYAGVAGPGSYLTPMLIHSTGSMTPTNGTLYTIPWFLPFDLPIDRISAEVMTAGSAGAVLRFGLFRALSPASNVLSLELDAGTVDATSTGVKEATVSHTIKAGVVHIGITQQGAPGTLAILRATSGTYGVPFTRADTFERTRTDTILVAATGVTGAFAASYANSGGGVGATNRPYPHVAVRVS